MSGTLLTYVMNIVDICQEHCWHMSGTLLTYANNSAGIWQQPYKSNSSDQQIRYL